MTEDGKWMNHPLDDGRRMKKDRFRKTMEEGGSNVDRWHRIIMKDIQEMEDR